MAKNTKISRDEQVKHDTEIRIDPITGKPEFPAAETPSHGEAGFLRSLMGPSKFGDPNKDRVAGLQYNIIVGIVVTCFIGSAISLLTSSTGYGFAIMIFEFLLSVFALYLQRRGYLEIINWLLVGPIYIIFLLGLSFTGFTFQNALLLALVISMVGLLFSFYSLIGIAVFITASLWVVPYFIPMPSLIKFSDLAYASIILAIESLLLVMASRSLQRSFAEADRSTQALLHTNRDLQELSKTLEQRVAERTRALATSSEVSRRLANIFDQKKLVDEVVNQVNDAFGYYHTQIYFFDPDKEHLVLAGGTGEAGDRMMAQFHKIKKGRGLVGRAADSNKMVLVTDTSKNREWLPNPLLPRTESEVAVPISIGDEVLGVLDVQHDVANSLNQEDVDSLQSVANQVAVALQNIRQYENSRKIASDMSVVASVGIATSTITDSQILLREMVEFTKKSFNLYHAHIYLLNEENNMLELAAGAGEVGQQMVAEKTSIPLNSEQSLVARAARSREGVVVNDVTLSSDFLANPLLPDTRAEMAVPMIAADKVIGVLDVQSEIVGHFTDVDVSIKTTLASQIAIALQNAKTLVDAQRQAERETRVNLITKKIQSTTSVEAALQITARELGHALGMRQTMVELDSTALDNDRKGKRS